MGFVKSVIGHVGRAMEGQLQLRNHLLSLQLLLLLFVFLFLLLLFSLYAYLLLRLLGRSLLHRLVDPHHLSRGVMVHLRDPRRHRGPLLLDHAVHLRGLGVMVDEKGDDEVEVIVAFGVGVGLNHSLCGYMKVEYYEDHSLRKMELRWPRRGLLWDLSLRLERKSSRLTLISSQVVLIWAMLGKVSLRSSFKARME